MAAPSFSKRQYDQIGAVVCSVARKLCFRRILAGQARINQHIGARAVNGRRVVCDAHSPRFLQFTSASDQRPQGRDAIAARRARARPVYRTGAASFMRGFPSVPYP
jgi:hypothetical protein